MKKNRSKVGQMRVIEVIIALFIIVMALGFTNLLSITPSSPKYETTELEKIGYNVMHDLDKQDLLPRFIYNQEWQNLTAALRITLPISVYFNLTVYRTNESTTGGNTSITFDVVNDEPVTYGENKTFSDAKDVVSVTYALVGYPEKITQTEFNAEYSPRILVLELTKG